MISIEDYWGIREISLGSASRYGRGSAPTLAAAQANESRLWIVTQLLSLPVTPSKQTIWWILEDLIVGTLWPPVPPGGLFFVAGGSWKGDTRIDGGAYIALGSYASANSHKTQRADSELSLIISENSLFPPKIKAVPDEKKVRPPLARPQKSF